MAAKSRILPVDDEPAITSNLAPFLERSGLSVAVAADGEQALRQVSSLGGRPRSDARRGRVVGFAVLATLISLTLAFLTLPLTYELLELWIGGFFFPDRAAWQVDGLGEALVGTLVGLVLLLNAVVGTANVIEDGAVLRRVIPALCWILAAVIWIAVHLGRAKRKE